MVAWVGTFALALTFCSALAVVGVGAWTASRSRALPSRWIVALPLVAAAVTVGAVEWALLTHDFAVRFVAENGSLSTPTYYTVTSLWAAHDGSLLLWVLIVTGYLALVGLRRRGSTALHGWATTVMAATAAFFAGLALFTTDVFDRVSPVPADGPGPNPLLADHPAMGVHPPLLYLGLLGMAVPFSFAIAGLVTGEVGPRWLQAVRSGVLSAWVLLTAGIVLGAWWSYAVLGWGGYWSWDPVENASLLPWLLATALLHSCMVQRSRRSLPAWNLALAVGAFVLACLASFLTRSGVVTSVHAFAESNIGPLLLGFLAALVACVAALVLLRPERLRRVHDAGPMLSRGTAVLVNNVLLTTVATIVLVGTLFPIVVEMADGNRVSVGPPYFNRAALPVALLVIAAMGVGPLLAWRGTSPATLARRLALPLGAALVVIVLVAALAPTGVLPLLAFGAATFVAVSAIAATLHGRGARRFAGVFAHVGVAIATVGIAGSSAYGAVATGTVGPGNRLDVAGHSVRLVSVQRRATAGSMQAAATVRVSDGAGDSRLMRPALRFVPSHQTTVALPAISSTPLRDVYLTLLSVDGKRSASLRVAVNPMVGWIWAGGGIVVLGGLVALWPRRRRTRAPARLPEADPEPSPAPARVGAIGR